MTQQTEIAIIGAGPYGLSIAAHLRARGVDFRIFGSPMQTWRTQMLRDSHLKSEGFASALYEPSGTFTLRGFCAERGLPYADIGQPVRRRDFVAYALEFQRRFVPNLEPREVILLDTARSGFTLRLEDGEIISARQVVIATGISKFAYTPCVLASLPPTHGSHSSAHHTGERFTGSDVAIVGAGASALDMAAELVRIGASRVRVVARRPEIRFHEPPKPRSLREKISAPMTGLGPGWRSLLCTDAPLLFHAMPERFRVAVVRRHLGPAPCWFTKAAVEGRVDLLLGAQVTEATLRGDKVALGIAGRDEPVIADHVIAATGYRVDLGRLSFLPAALRGAIRLTETSPALSTNFESSVAGLYFVGAAAANSFGPLSRFAFGANFTAGRLSAHLARTARHRVAVAEAVAA